MLEFVHTAQQLIATGENAQEGQEGRDGKASNRALLQVLPMVARKSYFYAQEKAERHMKHASGGRGGVLATKVTSAEALLWAVPSQGAEFGVQILFPSLTASYSACLQLRNSPRLTGGLTDETQGMSLTLISCLSPWIPNKWKVSAVLSPLVLILLRKPYSGKLRLIECSQCVQRSLNITI